ncbi:DUF3040 domain-containing protein [Streptomyces sp. NPDC101175]|uniref:DUF3040 domain-containing protein n=1 Tax=Streptomyces sp. NPDC101175 TaxID=3366123 RepID=UPI0038390C62
MESRNEPDGVTLSSYELLALARIEAGLREDRDLVRLMRHPVPRPWLPLAVAALTCASLLLLVVGVFSPYAAVLWCLLVLWPFAVMLAFRMLRRPVDGTGRTRSWP